MLNDILNNCIRERNRFLNNGGYEMPESDYYPKADKSQPFRTFMHYTDSDAKKQVTVFGRKVEGLFYNYDDRLFGKKWQEGAKLANEKNIPRDTVLWYEFVINHFHGTNNVDIRHIILGCNRSNGYSYLVFGYFGGK